MIIRLVAKEVQEHRWVALGVALLAVAEYLAFLEFSLRHEPPTALVAAINFTWGVGPMVAAYSARRLFVIEQEQRTILLLRSLPVPPLLITATKFSLGLLYNLVLNLAVLWVSAWVLKNQEVLTDDWVNRLSIQVVVYIFAWFALASFHAQLGGYRFAVWIVFLVALMSFEGVFDQPTRNLFWTAPLADDIETTRYAAPWDAVFLGAVWAIGATVATFGLAAYRGGTWVDGWFGPMSGRRRAEVTGATILALLALEVASNLGGWQPALPPPVSAEAPRIRTTDRELEPLVERVRSSWRSLESRFGLPAPPRTLIRVRRDDRPEPLLTSILGSGDLIVGLRAEAPDAERVRLVVADMLTGLSAGHWEHVPAAGVWAAGFAAYALDGEALASTAARLAVEPPVVIEDFDRVWAHYGRRGTEAAGWLAWRAAEETAGDEGVRRLARTLFGVERSHTGAGLAWARRTDPIAILEGAGGDREALFDAWKTEVEARRARFEHRPRWSLQRVQLERPIDQPPRLVWRDLAIDIEQHRVELWWSVADELHPYPVPQDELQVGTVDYLSGAHLLDIDPRRRVVTTWVVDGEVLGWTEVLR